MSVLSDGGEIRTYRGRSVEELIPQIRAELGPGAIILRERQGLVGGVGGFFAQRCVEIEAQAAPRIDVLAGDDDEELLDAGPFTDEELLADEERELDEAEFAAASAPRFLEQLAEAAAAPVLVSDPSPLMASTPAPELSAPAAVASAPAAVSAAPASVAGASPFRAVGTPTERVDAEPAEVRTIAIPVTVQPLPAPAGEPPAPIGPFRAAAHSPALAATVRETPAQEVPAAESHTPEAATPPAPPSEVPVPAAPIPDVTAQLARRLTERGLSPALADALVAEATVDLPAAPAAVDAATLTAAVRDRLAATLPTPAPLPVNGGAVAIVGPGGSGRTRTVVALARACAAAGHTVTVARLGTPSPALELAELLRDDPVEVLPAMRTRASARAVGAARERGLVLIDTPALAPGEAAHADVLAEMLDPFELDGLLLTVPAGSSPRAAARLVAESAALAPTGLIATHVSAGDELGAVAEAALRHRVPAGHAQLEASAGIRELDAAQLAAELTR